MRIRFDLNIKQPKAAGLPAIYPDNYRLITNILLWKKDEEITDCFISSKGVWYREPLIHSKTDPFIITYYIDTDLIQGNNSMVVENYLPMVIKLRRDELIEELV